MDDFDFPDPEPSRAAQWLMVVAVALFFGFMFLDDRSGPNPYKAAGSAASEAAKTAVPVAVGYVYEAFERFKPPIVQEALQPVATPVSIPGVGTFNPPFRPVTSGSKVWPTDGRPDQEGTRRFLWSTFYATGQVWCFQSPRCYHLGDDIPGMPGAEGRAPVAGYFLSCGDYGDSGATIGKYFIYRLEDGTQIYMGHFKTTNCNLKVNDPVPAGYVVGNLYDLDTINGSPSSHTHVQVTAPGGQLVDFVETIWCKDPIPSEPIGVCNG